MKLMIMAMLKTIFNAVVAKPMVFFLLRMLARQSETLIDDKGILFFEKAIDGDIEGTQKALKEALEQIEKEING